MSCSRKASSSIQAQLLPSRSPSKMMWSLTAYNPSYLNCSSVQQAVSNGGTCQWGLCRVVHHPNTKWVMVDVHHMYRALELRILHSPLSSPTDCHAVSKPTSTMPNACSPSRRSLLQEVQRKKLSTRGEEWPR
jgi:hypothetical protein